MDGMEYIPAKTLLSKPKDSSWFGLDYNMNLYRGCCHGCIYCDSRSDCYHIEGFDQVRAKENALVLLRDELKRKVRSGVVGMGSMSDPYNPYEQELLLTRHALELISAFGFGAAIATKSSLITRDLDILQEIQKQAPVLCKITITSLDDGLCSQVEPNAPLSSQRFQALEKLASAGLFSGILLMPVLPFLEDNPDNILGIVRRAADCGAKFLYPAFGMTLRGNQKEWYFQRLEERFPGQGLPERYQKRYGERYYCASPRAKELWEVFSQECGKLGLLYSMKDIVRGYRLGYETQLSFFS